jgi:hypothetical protein
MWNLHKCLLTPRKQFRKREGLQRGATAANSFKKGAFRDAVIFLVFRIRIHLIRMFLGLPDPLVSGLDQDPDPDPDPDPSIIKQNIKKKLKAYCFVTSFGLFIFDK